MLKPSIHNNLVYQRVSGWTKIKRGKTKLCIIQIDSYEADKEKRQNN